MCDKTLDDYAHAFQFIPDCCKTQKVCKKAVDTYLSAMQFVPDQF